MTDPPPPASVTGRPPWTLTENAVPVTLRLEIVTAEELRFTRETVAVAVLPTATEPKLTVEGDTWRIPTADPSVADPPQPERRSGSQIKSERKTGTRQPTRRETLQRLRARPMARREHSTTEVATQLARPEPHGGQTNSYITNASTSIQGN